MHRWIILFLSVPVLSFAQRKVSDVCSSYKLRMDSMMRVTYGDTLFEKYFVFDTNSYVWVDHSRMCSWNDSLVGDSITSVEFWYNFAYPGAQISPYDGYRPTSTIMWIFEDSLSYHGRCINISPESTKKLTRRKLHRSLKRCYVNLYTEDYFFGVHDRDYDLDSSHVYLEVNFDREIGGHHRGARFWSWHYSILIDACTGEYIGKDKDYFSGIKGAHF